VSIGKGLKAKPQKQDGGSSGNIHDGNTKRASGSGTFASHQAN
jgi:hypothetical protein